jgi:2-polyprenyl-3-methyl-5-hydroxy-6-metoxy-1,4-benzoquinol methylase
MNLTLDKKIYSNQGNINVINAVPDKCTSILDVGCGAGDNARILKERGKIVDGITLSKAEAFEAGKYCRKVIIYDVENGLPEGLNETYDIIICSHVLEHIRYPQKVLADVGLKLKEHSILIVALPNIMVYKYRLKLIAGKFEYEDGGVMDNTHLKWYTFKTGKQLLEDNGFFVEKAWVDGGIPFKSKLGFLNPQMEILIKKFLFKISPGFFGGELFYIAKNEVK